MILTLAPQAFAKGPGPGNSWTQTQNTYVPGEGGSPYCSPCVRWVIGSSYHQGYWSYHISGPGTYHSDTRSAVADWNSQQFRSPVFTEHSGTCSNDDVCITIASLDPRYCGYAFVYPNANNYIYHSLVEMTTNKRYIDGPVNSVIINGKPQPNPNECDLRWVMHHEVGHSFSEGHSGVYNDLMNPNQTLSPHERVDADAQAELRAVYGTYQPSTSGCPCVSLDDLKEKMAQLADSLSATPTSTEPLAPASPE